MAFRREPDSGPRRPHGHVDLQQRPRSDRRGSDDPLRVRDLCRGSGRSPKRDQRELQQHRRLPKHRRRVDVAPGARLPCCRQYGPEQRLPRPRGRSIERQAVRVVVGRPHGLLGHVLGSRGDVERCGGREFRERGDGRVPMGGRVQRQGRCRILRHDRLEQRRWERGLERVPGPDDGRWRIVHSSHGVRPSEPCRRHLHLRHRLWQDSALVAVRGTSGRSGLDEPQEVLLDALEFVRAAGPRFED